MHKSDVNNINKTSRLRWVGSVMRMREREHSRTFSFFLRQPLLKFISKPIVLLTAVQPMLTS